MNRSFVRHTSIIIAAIFLAVFWYAAITQLASGEVNLSMTSSVKSGSYVNASPYTLFCILVPMTGLWGFAVYKYYFKPSQNGRADHAAN